jgi:outer membrane immunogenic protein
MKRVLLSGVGMLTLAALMGSASAADLQRRYDPMVTKAPMMVPMYNWTGFYIGVNGGGGFGKSDWTTTNGFDLSGGLVGGTVGYNFQTGPWVFGVEGDLDWSNIKGDTVVGCRVGCETSNTWLATVRGRVGYSFDRFLPYITGGLALGDIRADVANVNVAKETNAGWTVGGGVEFVVVNNWTIKAEYLYVDLGDFNCGVACGVRNPDLVSFRSHIARGGINYRF